MGAKGGRISAMGTDFGAGGENGEGDGFRRGRENGEGDARVQA